MQIVKTAAYATAAGPVVLILGKITKGVGTLSTGIGKLVTAVSKAGGGCSGFLAVLGKSPAVWLAIAAATVTAVVAFADYISGAKQALEALEAMNETAQQWKNTAAETFYGTSEGLSFFGMSDSDFSRQAQSAQDWLDGLLKVWTDGEKETDEIVSSWTDSFKALTASTREELSNLKATADESGYTGVQEQLAKDIETLDSLDAEIESLLKKRQNGYFSESDQIRLQELIDTRKAIEIKYNLTPADTDGFEGIAQKIEAEVARAQSRGQNGAAVSVYENAVKAAAEGMAAVNAELDAQYDKEYAIVQLIEDPLSGRTHWARSTPVTMKTALLPRGNMRRRWRVWSCPCGSRRIFSRRTSRWIPCSKNCANTAWRAKAKSRGFLKILPASRRKWTRVRLQNTSACSHRSNPCWTAA